MLLNQKGQTEEEFLASYHPGKYERPSVTADILVFTVSGETAGGCRGGTGKSLRLLLIRRKDHPFIGKWALPGGFVRMEESLEQAARRELEEETGVRGLYMEQLHTWGDVGRDPRTRVISCSFLALAPADRLSVSAGDDAADAGWFSVSSAPAGDGATQLRLACGGKRITAEIGEPADPPVILSPGELAFDHAGIIAYGLGRLRERIREPEIAGRLTPEESTPAERREIAETVLQAIRRKDRSLEQKDRKDGYSNENE